MQSISSRLVVSLALSLVLVACDDDSSTPTTADSGPGPDVAVQADSGSQADSNETPTGDAGVGVECGPDLCDPGTEKCCVSASGGGATTEECVLKEDQCQGADVTCDGPEDCESPQICCGSLVGGGSSECAAVDSCDTGFVLCSTSDDCPEAKPNCCDSPVLAAKQCQVNACAP